MKNSPQRAKRITESSEVGMTVTLDRRISCVNEEVAERAWARFCATAGAAVWAGLAVLARVGILRVGSIELLFLFAPLVIVPLGMELGREVTGGNLMFSVTRRMQPVGAAFAVAALWLPPGRMAGLLACGWMAVCLLMAGAGLVDWFSAWRSGAFAAGRGTYAIARIDLAVGGAWFVASRLGMRALGIQEPIGLLTAVHFHFAGFATATIAAALLKFAGHGSARLLKSVVALVVGMPFVVAVGFVTSAWLKMGAGVLFSVSVAALAVLLRANSRKMIPTARFLLQIAATAVFAGMVLSGSYAVADFLGSTVLTVPQMARTHGVLNSVGFCLPGLLGWLVEVESSGLTRR